MPRSDPSFSSEQKQETPLAREASHIVIPIELWTDKELPILAKILVAEIESLSRKTGYCYAGNEYLATFLNVTPGRISQLLSLLKDKGFIVEEGRDNQFNTRTARRLFLQDSAINKLKAAFRKLNYIYNSSKDELKDNIKPSRLRAEERKASKTPSPKKRYATDSLEFQLATLQVELIRKWNPEFPRPNIDKWAADFDWLLNIRKFSYPRVEAVLRFWQGDEFWRDKGAGDPGYLRRPKKFDELEFKAISEGRRKPRPGDRKPQVDRKPGEGFGKARVHTVEV